MDLGKSCVSQVSHGCQHLQYWFTLLQQLGRNRVGVEIQSKQCETEKSSQVVVVILQQPGALLHKQGKNQHFLIWKQLNGLIASESEKHQGLPKQHDDSSSPATKMPDCYCVHTVWSGLGEITTSYGLWKETAWWGGGTKATWLSFRKENYLLGILQEHLLIRLMQGD